MWQLQLNACVPPPGLACPPQPHTQHACVPPPGLACPPCAQPQPPWTRPQPPWAQPQPQVATQPPGCCASVGAQRNQTPQARPADMPPPQARPADMPQPQPTTQPTTQPTQPPGCCTPAQGSADVPHQSTAIAQRNQDFFRETNIFQVQSPCMPLPASHCALCHGRGTRTHLLIMRILRVRHAATVDFQIHSPQHQLSSSRGSCHPLCTGNPSTRGSTVDCSTQRTEPCSLRCQPWR